MSAKGAFQPLKSTVAAAQIDFIRVISKSSTLTRSARLPSQEPLKSAGMLASSINMPRRVRSSLINRADSGSI